MDASVRAAHGDQAGGLLSRVGHFTRHGVEMCMTMCVGLMVLDTAYAWAAAQAGVADPFVAFPILSAAVVTFNMTAPMVAWMRFRGMDWRPIAEMSAAMLVEAVLVVLAYWLGAIPEASRANGRTSLYWWQHGLMMPAMLVPMLLRLDYYTGGMHHHAHPPH